MIPDARMDCVDEAAPPDFPREWLSLCMIVKDEARCLRRCLESARDWVGEMVVVDTGSTDDTVAIARAMGARVIEIEWPDDFSAARNVSLDAATNPWALVLDADEVLEVTDAVGFAQALFTPTIAAYGIACLSVGDDAQTTTANVVRLYRRDWPDMRYRGQIHEQLQAITRRVAPTQGLSAIRIHHDGYLPDVVAHKSKGLRNLTLARALTASQPEDPHAWYALGISLGDGEVNERIHALERAWRLLESHGPLPREDFFLHLLLMLAQSHERVKQPQAARAVIETGLQLFPASSDLHHLKGSVLLSQGEYALAAEAFCACLEPGAMAPVLTGGANSYAARCDLGVALTHLGEAEQAVRVWEAALAIAPVSYTKPLALLGQSHLQQGRWQAARPLLARAFALQPARADLALALGWCESKLDEHASAITTLQPFADVPQVQALLGRCLLEVGRATDALAALDSSPLPSVDLLRGWAHWVKGDPQRAAGAWEAWLRAGAADWGSKDSLARMIFLLQGGRAPQTEPERIAEPVAEMTGWFRILVRHGRFEDIDVVLERAPRLGVRLWRALRRSWAKVLREEGINALGEQMLQAARNEQPGVAEDAFDLAQIALERQDVSGAIALLRECLIHNPAHLAASETLSSLVNLGFR